LLIVEPVSQLYFDSPYLNSQQLTLIAGQPADLRCIAVGGNPPPLLEVYLDWFNITSLFDLRRSFDVRRPTDSGRDRDSETTVRGLRAVDARTVLETRRFVARVRDHALTLYCRSSASSNVRSIVTNVTLFVNCQYIPPVRNIDIIQNYCQQYFAVELPSNLYAKRDSLLTDKLRSAKSYPIPHTRTTRYKNSFLPFGLIYFQ